MIPVPHSCTIHSIPFNHSFIPHFLACPNVVRGGRSVGCKRGVCASGGKLDQAISVTFAEIPLFDAGKSAEPLPNKLANKLRGMARCVYKMNACLR